MVCELDRGQSARGYEIIIRYCRFISVEPPAPVTGAELFQGTGIIARMGAVVQKTGIGETKRCPADRCNSDTALKDLVHFFQHRFLCRIQPGVRHRRA